MASPAAVLSILIRAQTVGKSHMLERFALRLDATQPELSHPMKASDPNRPSNRAERRRGIRKSGDSAVQALMRHIDELQADPRPWRKNYLTDAEEAHAAELAVEFAHLIDKEPVWVCPVCGFESFAGYFASGTVCPKCPHRPEMRRPLLA